jgi:hypothetical protein
MNWGTMVQQESSEIVTYMQIAFTEIPIDGKFRIDRQYLFM